MEQIDSAAFRHPSAFSSLSTRLVARNFGCTGGVVPGAGLGLAAAQVLPKGGGLARLALGLGRRSLRAQHGARLLGAVHGASKQPDPALARQNLCVQGCRGGAAAAPAHACADRNQPVYREIWAAEERAEQRRQRDSRGLLRLEEGQGAELDLLTLSRCRWGDLPIGGDRYAPLTHTAAKWLPWSKARADGVAYEVGRNRGTHP
jgi:hypothetical protein